MRAKRTLRSDVLARRDAMPEEVRARKSEEICRRLERAVLARLDDARAGGCLHANAPSSAPAVAVFASMRSEVDLKPFVDTAYRRGWDVCFPCMVREAPGEEARMQFYRIPFALVEAAQKGFLGTPMRCLPCAALAAEGYETVAADELDAVVVPLVAFDDDGDRLGYGGGNYDRLLPLLREDALIVGVAFEEQRVDAVPCEPHDQPLPCVISA